MACHKAATLQKSGGGSSPKLCLSFYKKKTKVWGMNLQRWVRRSGVSGRRRRQGSHRQHFLCQKVPRLTQLQPGYCAIVGTTDIYPGSLGCVLLPRGDSCCDTYARDPPTHPRYSNCGALPTHPTSTTAWCAPVFLSACCRFLVVARIVLYSRILLSECILSMVQ